MRIIATVAVLCAIFIVPTIAESTPNAYRIDLTTTYGDGSIAPVIFTYDPSTELFTGLSFLWTFSHTDLFDLMHCPTCGDFGLNTRGGNVNFLTSSEKASVLANFLAGGGWAADDTTTLHDSFFAIGAIRISDGGGSANTTAFAGGTFTTTAVPEPASALLLMVGLAGCILFVRQHLHMPLLEARQNAMGR